MAAILFIDDEKEIRNLMNVMLTRLGHTPTLAARGDEGLRMAQSNKFDLIILDLMMPDMDGFEVTRRLRADPRTKHIPILIFTARTQPADMQSALQAGANDYLAKPLEPRELGARINALLSAPVGAAQPVGAGAQAEAPGMETKLSSRMFVALGLRGGVGTTTFAVSLAGGLTQLGRRVCLIDLVPTGGLVALQLGLRPKSSWADLSRRPDLTNTGAAFVRHVSGLFVVAAPPEPVRKSLAGETFQIMLTVLDGVFDDIVVRAAPVLDDATCAALASATYVFLVLSPEVGAVQTGIGTLQTLKKLAIPENHVRVVLNQVMPESTLSSGRVEKALGRPLDLSIPYDRAQAAAFAQGTPLVFTQPNAPLAAGIRNLVARL